jgi:hypothetical protein
LLAAFHAAPAILNRILRRLPAAAFHLLQSLPDITDVTVGSGAQVTSDIVSHTRRELELWTRAGEERTRQVVTAQELRLRRGAVLSVDRLYADLPE